MKLPQAEQAVVPEAKITQYLLNSAHPVGGAKAAFFFRFGFTNTEWQKLADALRLHAQENEVAEAEETRYGKRFVIEGRIIAPDGTSLNVRSAWYIDVGGGPPRFVTAHPLPKA